MTGGACDRRFPAFLALVVGAVAWGARASLTTATEPAQNTSASGEVVTAEKPLCGAYCLFVGLLALDVPVDSLDAVQGRLGSPPRSGYSFAQLARVAEEFGLHALGVETTLERLQARSQRFVCIAHLRSNHFANIAGVGDHDVTYYDPPARETVPTLTFNALWDGKALLLAREPLIPEEEIVLPAKKGVWWWWVLTAAIVAAIVAARWILNQRAAQRSAA